MAALVAENRGYDLFSSNGNLLLMASEYAAKYSLNESVPCDLNFFRCEAVLVDGAVGPDL
jgi:hypothetical protein